MNFVIQKKRQPRKPSLTLKTWSQKLLLVVYLSHHFLILLSSVLRFLTFVKHYCVFFKALPYSCLLNFPLPFFVDFFSLEIHAILSIKNVYNNSKRRFSQTLKRRSHKMLICKLFKNTVTNNHLLTTITFKEIKHYIKPASRTSTTFQARQHKKKILGMTFICFIVGKIPLIFPSLLFALLI